MLLVRQKINKFVFIGFIPARRGARISPPKIIKIILRNPMKRIQDLDVREKRVLVRCDFNVPLSEDFSVLDDFRIKKTLATIEYLISQNAKVILMSHLGRPEGKKRMQEQNLSLEPISKRLSDLLGKEIIFLNDCVGPEIENRIETMKPGEVLLLENLRFYKEEEANDESFAKNLAKLADIYINDAFGASHRVHASIAGVPKYLPSAAGFLLEKEIEVLSNLIEEPQRPLIVIIGGAKVETKSALISRFSEMADFVLISGLIQKEIKEKNLSFENPDKIMGPSDEIGGGRDIGFETIDLFERKILEAETIFWNGPLGQIEKEEFGGGTECIARFIADATGRALTIIGGGETVEFVSKLGLIDKYSHVSTGGGAMLEFLSGKKLPGIEALN